MKSSTVETVNQLIEELRALKSPSEALAVSLNGLREHPQNGLLHFFAGRAHVLLSQPEDAVRHLELCRRLSPRHHWAAYELARAHALADCPAAAVEALSHFLFSHAQALNAVQLDWCEKILDKEFEGGQRPRLAPLYRRLLELGGTRYLSVLRAFEGAVEAGELTVAGELLEQLGTPRDAWSHLAVCRYHALAHDAERVEQHALAAIAAAPDHPIVALASAELLARMGCLSSLRRSLAQWRGQLPEPDHALIETLAAAKAADLTPDLLLACDSPHANRWHFIAYLYEAGARLPEDRSALYGALLRRFPADGDLLMCLCNLEVARRDFEQALAFCREGLAAAADPALQRDFRFKQFELACFTSRLDEAAALLRDIDLGPLDDMQRAAIARYHAERGQWAEAMATLQPLLARAEALSQDHALLIVRAARKVKSQAAVLRALGTGAAREGMGAYLASALFEDWIVSAEVAPSDAVEMARSLGLDASSLLEFKLAALAPAKRAALAEAAVRSRRPRRAVFFCADKAYVLPALVSLSSLLAANTEFADASFHLVVDDTLLGLAEEASHRVASHFGAAVQLQKASELVPAPSQLAAGYGLFTGGQQLAVAAYYRIYMARLLAERGDFDQLLYIDSDTVIGPGFDGILAEPVPEGALLMARLEVDRPEVRQAIAQHGLAEGMYFNSGVLWFPRSCDALVVRLTQAVQAAEQRGPELLFQDQCALNIGFAGAFAPLPERYNFFAGPHDEHKLQRTPAGEVRMLHVLDRPKPWDSAYPRGSMIQQRWLNGAHALRRIIGKSALEPLLGFTIA